MDGGAWWITVHGVAKSWTRLSDLTLEEHNGRQIFKKKKKSAICLIETLIKLESVFCFFKLE